MTKIRCWKCKGEGVIGAYLHVQAGRCFRCGGTGEIEVDPDKDRLFAVEVDNDVVKVGFFDECKRLVRRLITEVGDQATIRRATGEEVALHGNAPAA